MILNLQRFVGEERPFWDELERYLSRLQSDPGLRLSVEEVCRLHYLYERAASDLARVATFAHAPELRQYIDGLVARAYGEIHDAAHLRKVPVREWFLRTLPQTFRRRAGAFRLAAVTTAVGVALGALVLALQPDAKEVLLPYGHLLGDPADRVREEESVTDDAMAGHRAQFSAFLMTHNTRVAILCLALGMTWGVGTLLLLFYNGVIIGAVAFDYVAAGQAKFLLGWLLPHGAVEIPAVLLGGQAGLVLASALIGRGQAIPIGRRIQAVRGDLVTLIGGAAIMLVWAGIVESFLSQYHEPFVPYSLKIGLGLVEGGLLALFFTRAGREKKEGKSL